MNVLCQYEDKHSVREWVMVDAPTSDTLVLEFTRHMKHLINQGFFGFEARITDFRLVGYMPQCQKAEW